MIYNYPKTPIKKVIDEIHGRKVADFFRWLENGKNSKVKKWVVEQNKFTQKLLQANSSPRKFQKELIKYFSIGAASVPIPVKGSYFWSERRALENQFVIYTKKGLNGRPRALINPNKINKSGTVSIAYWRVSPEGNYIAYGLSRGGDEMATLHILNVRTGKNIKEKIPHTRYASISWLPDETGFYYTRHPSPDSVPKGEEYFHCRIYFHKIGQDPRSDKLIFGPQRPKEENMDTTISPDGRYLVITSTDNWLKNNVYLYDIYKDITTPIVENIKARFIPYLAKDKIYFLTNHKAENYRVIATETRRLPLSVNKWPELIKEKKYPLQDISFTYSKILVTYLVNVSNKIEVLNYSGRRRGKVSLPKFSLASVGARRTEKEFFFEIESFLSSGEVYRYDPKRDNYFIYKKAELTLSDREYVVEQKWYKSKDGTRVPMFTLYKRGVKLKNQNPTLLYGYGGFEHLITPNFPKVWLPFIKRGGVFAIANIRGGGEFGKKWHTSAILGKKQKSFDDFIWAAEFLIKRKYTSPEKLGIAGRSNGGLLVGACFTQRPNLFKAAVSIVPLLDMLRFPKFFIAKRWVSEYGDPAKLKDFKNIIKWSPYHNVKKDVEYPNVLFTTAENDSRVDPFHAYKMAALLQSINKRNVILLRTEVDAGHGPGKPLNKTIKEQADILSFLHWQLMK